MGKRATNVVILPERDHNSTLPAKVRIPDGVQGTGDCIGYSEKEKCIGWLWLGEEKKINVT